MQTGSTGDRAWQQLQRRGLLAVVGLGVAAIGGACITGMDFAAIGIFIFAAVCLMNAFLHAAGGIVSGTFAERGRAPAAGNRARG
ncbi:MAG: hypothetical protein OXK82_05675 [Deltaproteobacteria bacterium]|nr:hypothetical protein [Deltaproteobacteria bacterium]